MVAGQELVLMAPLSKVYTSLTQVMTASDLHIQMDGFRLSSFTVYQMFAATLLAVYVDLKRRKRRNDVKIVLPYYA